MFTPSRSTEKKQETRNERALQKLKKLFSTVYFTKIVGIRFKTMTVFRRQIHSRARPIFFSEKNITPPRYRLKKKKKSQCTRSAKTFIINVILRIKLYFEGALLVRRVGSYFQDVSFSNSEKYFIHSGLPVL